MPFLQTTCVASKRARHISLPCKIVARRPPLLQSMAASRTRKYTRRVLPCSWWICPLCVWRTRSLSYPQRHRTRQHVCTPPDACTACCRHTLRWFFARESSVWFFWTKQVTCVCPSVHVHDLLQTHNQTILCTGVVHWAPLHRARQNACFLPDACMACSEWSVTRQHVCCPHVWRSGFCTVVHAQIYVHVVRLLKAAVRMSCLRMRSTCAGFSSVYVKPLL